MNASVSNIFVTGEFAMAKTGYRWHRMYDEGMAICGKKLSGLPQTQRHPDSRHENYCKKCMPHSNFRVVQGVVVW